MTCYYWNIERLYITIVANMVSSNIDKWLFRGGVQINLYSLISYEWLSH